MAWQLAVSLHLLFTTAFALRHRVFARDNKNIGNSVNAIIYGLIIAPFGLLWGLTYGSLDLSINLTMLLLLILGGILFATSNNMAYRANEEIDAAQFSITTNLGTVTTIFLSSLLLGEVLTMNQLAGVGLIILAALIISIHKATRNTFVITAGSFAAVAAAVASGAGNSNEKYLLDQMDMPSYLMLGWGMQALAMIIIASGDLKVNHGRYFNRKVMPRIIELGILRLLAGVFFITALVESDNSSLVAGAAAYKTALIVVGGYLFLKEGSRLHVKLLSAAMATAGLLMLIQ